MSEHFIRGDTKLDDLPLSVRTSNCLMHANIHTVDDLSKWTPQKLLKLRNFGRKCLKELEKEIPMVWKVNSLDQVIKGSELNGPEKACDQAWEKMDK